eukprot:CAMPEP_0168563294 /NCGR_PEP_ID=MMETSP0413-20121227/12601_1 /TAXON_ID=136452 /ORGANISM="Filamoeba nolandi, Strain NC-AS-23-1" /LENGTH=227 /DNA_ID=CAMNT_0008594821 /DNA_START=24 /DNA_END=707 /DNA_ORIENTATION=-
MQFFEETLDTNINEEKNEEFADKSKTKQSRGPYKRKRCSFHRLRQRKCYEECKGRMIFKEEFSKSFITRYSEELKIRKKQKKLTEEEQLDIAIELWEKTKEKDEVDFIRGWGFQLLAEDDPCFKEKEYINEAVQFISSYGISIWLSPEEMEKPDSILSRFMFQLNKIKSIPFKILPFAFTLTASDAVNLLPSICAVALKFVMGQHVEILPDYHSYQQHNNGVLIILI